MASYPEKKIDAVSNKVGVVGSAIGKKVDAVNRKVHEVGCKVEKKIDVVDEKIGAVCDKVDVIGGVSVEKIDVIGDKVDEIGHATENKIDAVCDKVDVVGGVVVEKIDAARDTVDAVDEKIDAVGDRFVKKADAVSDRIVGKVDAVGDRIVEKVDAVGGVREKKIDVVGGAVGAVDKKIDKVGGKVNKIPSLLAMVIQQVEKRDWTLARQLRFSNTRIAKKVDALDSKVGGKVDALGNKVDVVYTTAVRKIDAVGDTVGVADKKIDVVGRKINATGDRVLVKVGSVESKVDTVLSCINAGSGSHCRFRSDWWEVIYRSALLVALVSIIMLVLLFAAFLIGVASNKKLDREAFSFTSTEKLCVTAGAFSRGSIPLLPGYFEECRKTLDKRFIVDLNEGSYFQIITPKGPASPKEGRIEKDASHMFSVGYIGVGPGVLGDILGYGAYAVFVLTALLASLSLVKMLVWDYSFSRFGIVSGTLSWILAMFGLSFYLATHTSTFMTHTHEKTEPYALYMGSVDNYETREYFLGERFEGKRNGPKNKLDELIEQIQKDD
uniref:Uncharacterized protein n=1 Tax=Candidatus Kentrum sp. TC TaxID=2126339 RepID=A0A450YN33_9GAMM|nr:MAG: hypothetical protein BECKTC1821D_GA0114238_101439 [Candidatus Kentron sp. TC]